MTDIREAREALIAVAMEAEGCTPAMRGACEVEYGGDCACTRLADDSIAALSAAGLTICGEQVGYMRPENERVDGWIAKATPFWGDDRDVPVFVLSDHQEVK